MTKLAHIATYECRRGWRRLDVAFYNDGERFVCKHREVRANVNLKDFATDADMGAWKIHMDGFCYPDIHSPPAQFAASIMRTKKYAMPWLTIEQVA